ncbi:hypothetical protein KSP40_PGU011643 [Platanthera guangdongensis]|uniref:Gnk2-homologous domain-containing protein n=1 Tax=Platanthera guangdongensis TaxID=2320717 RepID=A0ABR2M881_9ASPA
MDFSHQLFLLALVIPLVVACIDPTYQHCGQNFTDNSILRQHINRVIISMVDTTPERVYAISWVSDDRSNSVYGLTRCRGDIGPKACSDCIVAASQDLQEFCPDTSASRIWHDLCFLRYDTTNFLGTIDNSDLKGWRSDNPTYQHCGQNFTGNSILQDNINKTIYSMIANTPDSGYAVSTIDNGSNTVYGLARCRRDIGPKACSDCIVVASQDLRAICPETSASHIWRDLCFLRYEITNFLETIDNSYLKGRRSTKEAELVPLNPRVETPPLSSCDNLSCEAYCEKEGRIGFCSFGGCTCI